MLENQNILLRRFALTNDAQAFSQLVQRNSGLVYGTCRRILGNPDKAADAAQETFFQLLRSAESITGSVSSWLHRVATNKSIDLIRRDSARRRYEAEYAGQKHLQAEKWEDISPYVDKALEDLDDETRDIIIAHFFRGLSMTDVASEINVSQPTVSRRIESGVAKLRKSLQKRGIILAGLTLAALLGESATEAAPAVVMTELAKMALVGGTAAASGAGAATATGAVTGVGAKVTGVAAMTVKAKIITAVAVAAIGTGTVITYNQVTKPGGEAAPARIENSIDKQLPARRSTIRTPRRTETSPPVDATDETPTIQSPPPATRARMGRARGGGAFFGTRTGTAGGQTGSNVINLSTPELTIKSFANVLAAGDMERIAQCFADNAEDLESLRRIMKSDDPKVARVKQKYQSIAPPIEIMNIESEHDGLKVTWLTTVKRPFTITERGIEKTYLPGDRYEMDSRLVKIDNQWRIAGL